MRINRYKIVPKVEKVDAYSRKQALMKIAIQATLERSKNLSKESRSRLRGLVYGALCNAFNAVQEKDQQLDLFG